MKSPQGLCSVLDIRVCGTASRQAWQCVDRGAFAREAALVLQQTYEAGVCWKGGRKGRQGLGNRVKLTGKGEGEEAVNRSQPSYTWLMVSSAKDSWIVQGVAIDSSFEKHHLGSETSRNRIHIFPKPIKLDSILQI